MKFSLTIEPAVDGVSVGQQLYVVHGDIQSEGCPGDHGDIVDDEGETVGEWRFSD